VRTLVAAAVSVLVALAACEDYQPPPDVSVEGMTNGVLTDPRAPFVVDFGMPIIESSVVVQVAFYEVDANGNLPDERTPPQSLRDVFKRDPVNGDFGVAATFEDGDTKLRLVPTGAMPVGPQLVLLLNPGLRSQDGRERHYRTRIPFSYEVQCAPTARPTTLQSGVYFLLLQVQKPIGTQIQLFGAIDVDSTSGAFVGQFTKARRNPDGNRCPTPCDSVDACRLYPSPQCVPPSTAAGTVDEYPDWVPNSTPPTGFSFEVHGCAVDDGNATNVLTQPATMIVQQPAVTVQGLTMSAQFAPGADGVVRATGNLTADDVYLGKGSLGLGSGTVTARHVPDGQVPPGVPKPPPGGFDAGSSSASPEGGPP
jgi:hypothetical protein